MIRIETFFLLSMILSSVVSKIFIDSLTAVENNDIGKVSSLLTKNGNQFVISANLSLKFDVTKALGFCNFTIPKDKNDRNFSRVVVKRIVNLCKVTAEASKIGKVILDEIAKFSDFEFKCPFKKGEMHITNMVIANKLIPKFLLGESLKYCWTCKILAKVESQSKFIHALTFKLSGEIRGD